MAMQTQSAPPNPTIEYDSGVAYVTALDGGVNTALPPLPQLTNVVAQLDDDTVSITFDPVDQAADYRVYPLPNDSDISVADGGHVTIQNATYRCAGQWESPPPTVDKGPMVPGAAIHTEVDQEMVGGYLRTLAGATLGYVYTQPGPGLVPVYVLGESNPNADSTCYFARWRASRVKDYTTSASEQASELASFARDDGIAFYVPAAGGSTTIQVYTDQSQVGTPYQERYYFVDGPEAAAHPNKVAKFSILASQAPGTQPLMRVFYANSCGWGHDELAVGLARFHKIYYEGDQQPWAGLLWSGITQTTTLVVEALDTLCPYQGLASAGHIDETPASGTNNSTITHQPFLTLDEMRANSPTAELFINGTLGPSWNWDGEGGTPSPSLLSQAVDGGPPVLPNAIARSFIAVAPNPHPAMDFLATFSPDASAETFTSVPCGSPNQNCYQTWREQSPTYDQMFISVESGVDAGVEGLGAGLFTYGPVMGELWVTYADKAGDTNGKYRLTPNQMATMSATSFLHVTMEVDAFSTSRRYPQLLISDQPAPVQYNMVNGHTLVVQPRAEDGESIDWPIDYQLEICNMMMWDVNQQCPVYDLYHVMDGGAVDHLAPNDELGDHASLDHRILWDVYTSTQRMYLFLDGQPYGCADLPSVGVPSGSVSITWGDVLYHSAVDHTFSFHAAHEQVETHRHFDNLGFSSNVPAPAWDESRLPCAPPISP
jgi:hypothetical protein